MVLYPIALALMVLQGCGWLGQPGGVERYVPAARPSTVGPASLARGAIQGQIKVGAVLTLSGDISVYGESQRKGLDLAVERINAAGGIGGATILLDVIDDAGTSDGAVAAFQRLVARPDVLCIMGPTLSTTAFAADGLAQRAGVPVLAFSNTADGIVELGDYVFRSALPEARVIPETLKAAREKLQPTRVAIIYNRTDAYARSSYQAFKRSLSESGIQIVADTSYASDDEDLTPQLLQIKASNPDAIVASSLGRDAVSLLRRARKLDITVPVIGGNGFNSYVVIKSAGTAADGLIVGTAWNIEGASSSNLEFVRAFRARYDESPDEFAAQAYLGVTILADSIARSGSSTDRVKLRDALASVDVDTILGRFRFLASREPDYDPLVQIVRHGKLAILR